jgi:TadE-like protein
MVEFALIALPFFMIIFGIIDFSILIFDMHSANAGSRASARFVGTGELETRTDCAMDFNNNFAPPPVTQAEIDKLNVQIDNLKRVICMTKNRSHLNPNRIRVLIRFEDKVNPRLKAQNPIEPGDSVVVCMMTRISSLTRLYSSILDGRSLNTTTRARLEGGQGFDYAKLTEGGERPFPGQTWTDCYKALTEVPTGWSESTDP